MVEITTKEIYDKLLDIERHVIKTNGSVTLNRWLATTALTASVILAGWFISHIK